MARIIAGLISWLAGKVVVYVVILGLLLVIFVVKVVPPLVTEHHERELEEAIAELGESRELVGELAGKVRAIGGEIENRTEELRELERKRAELEAMWEKVKNFFRRDEVRRERERIAARQAGLMDEIRVFRTERDALRARGGETEEELKRRELLRDEKEAQLEDIRELRGRLDSLMRNELRHLAFNALRILAAILLVPFVWKVVAYYVIAPLARSTEPILLGRAGDVGGEIVTTASHPAQRIRLDEGDVLLTKVDYLQGSMGNFDKRTQWLMDWRFPLSSVAAGMFLLTRIRNSGVGRGEVTLSTQDDATEELAVVMIPEGSSLVFRPHYLVGVGHREGRPPGIRSEWVFGKVHAWVNLRFRYMIVDGPARMVFAAQRGVQVEKVLAGAPGRRVNGNLTAAFSPHLAYSPMRAETFMAYLRGKNGLFDDFFQGEGLVIQQQVTGGAGNPVARIWQGVLGAVGKVFGI